MFHNNIVEIAENMNKHNLLKICLQVTYPTDFCIICIHSYYGKSVLFDLKKQMTRIKLFVHR